MIFVLYTLSTLQPQENESVKDDDFIDGVFVTQGNGSICTNDQIPGTRGHDRDNFPGVTTLTFSLAFFLQSLSQRTAAASLFFSLVKYIKQVRQR